MSPEQCRGKTLDRRSDLFSMGAVLFEMLTGTALFRRDTEHATYKAICDEPIPRPSELIAGLPADLDRITVRALARHRGERYETASEMRADLMAAISSTHGAGSADEALEAVMRRLFADRIEEKAEMLRRARSGSPLLHVPPADVDEEVDLPTMGSHPMLPGADESALRSVADLPDASHSHDKRRGSARSWAAAAVVAAVTAGAFALTRRQLDTGPDRGAGSPMPGVPPSSDTARPASASTMEPTRGEAVPSRVRVRLETTPPGARITIDGHDHGVTPEDLELVRSDASVTVVLTRDGFHPVTERLVPATDQRLVLPLRPVERATRPRAPAPTAPPTTPPSAAPTPSPTIEKLP
jgi:hypothetical protein